MHCKKSKFIDIINLNIEEMKLHNLFSFHRSLTEGIKITMSTRMSAVLKAWHK